MPPSPLDSTTRLARTLVKRLLGPERTRALRDAQRRVETITPGAPPPYHRWLETRIAERAPKFPAPPNATTLSVMTAAYERTHAGYLDELAASLFTQDFPFHEWLLLAQGPIPHDTELVIARLQAMDPRVRVLRLERNEGIMPAFRVCLAEATGDYVLPVDADDLLTPDALRILASEIARNDRPVYLYSDEDMLIGGTPRSPYLRPSWDPVLNLASSFVWHLAAIRRDTAITLQLYADRNAEFCHDWDTTVRIAAAGHEPVHIPEVLYHWRQHEHSSTNRANPQDEREPGSVRSTRAVLQNAIARTSVPSRYRIDNFPIYRGADELYIHRIPDAMTGVSAIVLTDGAREPSIPSAPLVTLHPLHPDRTRAADLRAVARSIETPHTLVISDRVHPDRDDWAWDAIKLMELHPELAIVGGRIYDADDRLIAGGTALNAEGRRITPDLGRPGTDPGPWAISLKPHCVAAAPTDLFLIETALLVRALDRLPDDLRMQALGLALGACALAEGRRVATGTLTRARAIAPLVEAEDEQASTFFDQHIETTRPTRPTRQSIAGFIEQAGWYIP
jgi:glycosyltransferase involved in cell wall biosynthesis